jgi:hypothetical protein
LGEGVLQKKITTILVLYCNSKGGHGRDRSGGVWPDGAFQGRQSRLPNFPDVAMIGLSYVQKSKAGRTGKEGAMRSGRLWVLVGLGVMLLLMGNVPAPYYACQGKSAGDPCSYGYGPSCMGPNGICQLSDSSVDNPSTVDLNEQLVCQTR